MKESLDTAPEFDSSVSDSPLEQELANFRDDVNVHDLPGIFHLWSQRYVLPKIQACGFVSLEEFFLHYIEEACRRAPGRIHDVASIGAGNCDFEVGLAERLLERGWRNVRIQCLELNPEMIERGRRLAQQRGVETFVSCEVADLERWQPDRTFSVCVAVHSLHHFVGLEDLFRKIRQSIGGDGVFLINDMIGRNGHQRWPEALRYVEGIWDEMPRRYKYNHQLQRWDDEFVNWDCAQSGNEGVRAQDILPLLMENFHFDVFIAFANIIDVFVDRSYGHNFDMGNPEDVAFIERVAELDEARLDQGDVKPTHLIGAVRPGEVDTLRCYRHWTPEFCVRVPD